MLVLRVGENVDFRFKKTFQHVFYVFGLSNQEMKSRIFWSL